MRGSDPAARGEVVIYTAHHDHLGIGEPNAKGDTIYNGARDNASGCGDVLAIGRAFAALPERPRRSIMLLFAPAEEQGLIGSQYFAEHPTVPAGDRRERQLRQRQHLGRNPRHHVIGFGKSTLDEVAHGRGHVSGPHRGGRPVPRSRLLLSFRPFNFAKIGVPAFYLPAVPDFVGPPRRLG